MSTLSKVMNLPAPSIGVRVVESLILQRLVSSSFLLDQVVCALPELDLHEADIAKSQQQSVSAGLPLSWSASVAHCI